MSFHLQPRKSSIPCSSFLQFVTYARPYFAVNSLVREVTVESGAKLLQVITAKLLLWYQSIKLILQIIVNNIASRVFRENI
jgi:hypothetical protein